MIIDAISNGIVIDHISAGKAMELYNILGLDKLDCSVALLKNVSSGKLGRCFFCISSIHYCFLFYYFFVCLFVVFCVFFH